MSTYDELTSLMYDVMDDESVEITEETLFSDLPQWDSVTAMRLIPQIEAAFTIKLPIREYVGLTKVRDLYSLINQLK